MSLKQDPHWIRRYAAFVVAAVLCMSCILYLTQDISSAKIYNGNPPSHRIISEAIEVRFKQQLNAKYLIVRNVCVIKSHNATDKRGKHQPVIYLQSFDKTLQSKEYQFRIKRQFGPTYTWILNNSLAHDDVTAFRNDTAAFAGFWTEYPNFYAHMYKSLSSAYDQIKYFNDTRPAAWGSVSSVYVAPASIKILPASFHSLFFSLGYKAVLQAPDVATQEMDSRCFKYAVLPQKLPPTPGDPGRERIKQTFSHLARIWAREANATDLQCQSHYALILQRQGTRRFTNVTSLVDATKERGYRDVRVTTLEDKQFAEQWNTVRCASLFAGVQGAGLTWHFFLPPNAAFIEIRRLAQVLWQIRPQLSPRSQALFHRMPARHARSRVA